MLQRAAEQRNLAEIGVLQDHAVKLHALEFARLEIASGQIACDAGFGCAGEVRIDIGGKVGCRDATEDAEHDAQRHFAGRSASHPWSLPALSSINNIQSA